MTRDKRFSACYVSRSKTSTLAKNVATNFRTRRKQHSIVNRRDSKPTTVKQAGIYLALVVDHTHTHKTPTTTTVQL